MQRLGTAALVLVSLLAAGGAAAQYYPVPPGYNPYGPAPYWRYGAPPPLPPEPRARRVIPEGPDREVVAEVQRQLNDLGYEAGAADGALGPQTAGAIRAWQRDRNQAPTGALSSALIADLRAAWVRQREDGRGDAADRDGAGQDGAGRCAWATSPVARRICTTPALAELDAEVGRAYAAARRDADVAAQAELQAEQRAWLRQRESCGANAECLRSAMEFRLQALGVAAPADGGATADAPPDTAASGAEPASGRFCVAQPENEFDMLLVRPRPDGALSFGLSRFSGGHGFSVAGTARAAGSSWRFAENLAAADPADRCAVTLTPRGGGYVVSTAETARCMAYGGHRAVPEESLAFPASSRIGEAPARLTAETVAQADCRPSRPAAPRRAAGP